MKILATKEGTTTILWPEGWIDSTNAQELEHAAFGEAADCDKMIIDFSKVDYISSAGIRAILAAYREMEDKDGLTLRSLNDNVANILRLTGFDQQLDIEE